MTQKFTVPGRLPGYNELHGNHWKTARIKKKAMQDVGWAAISARIGLLPCPVVITIRCFEPNAKRDPDNVISGAAKCVLDALQNIRVLKNDNRKCVTPHLPAPEIDRDNPRVEVEFSAIREVTT